jgi:protein-disulfide isomerase
MADAQSPLPRTSLLFVFGTVCALLGGVGGWLAGTIILRGSTEKLVRDYVVSHGEILPEAMENLRHKKDAEQLLGIRAEVEQPFAASILGNPNGKQILVEFTDFACTYCRRSVADVEQLIAGHPDLKVVVRQLPILSPNSADAAKMGLAAAQQGKYAAFHRAMFELGQVDSASISAAAQAAGLDMVRAKQALNDPKMEAELAQNIEFAKALGFTGTPAWVAGKRLLSGAVGPDRLAEALNAK